MDAPGVKKMRGGEKRRIGKLAGCRRDTSGKGDTQL